MIETLIVVSGLNLVTILVLVFRMGKWVRSTNHSADELHLLKADQKTIISALYDMSARLVAVETTLRLSRGKDETQKPITG
jgi:hypothetical protein